MKTYACAFLFLFIFFSCQTENNEPLILQEGEVSKKIHKDNIGKITFMNGYVPFDDYQESDFLKSFTLSDQSNLGIRVFLNKTLTYQLDQLTTDSLSVTDLCNKGNYKFTFYVDDKIVYEEKLNYGAGSCFMKNSMTVFYVPLASTEEEDSWGRFLWMRFMGKGGSKALTAGTHQLKIEIRPYLDLEKTEIGEVLAQGQIELNVVKKEVTESEIAIQPIVPNSGWEISSEKYDQQRIIALNKKIAQLDFKNITSVVIIKNNKLLMEEYFNGAKRETLHNTRSVGKSFISTALGIAINDGHIKDENVLLKNFYELSTFQNFSENKKEVSLKNFLTMSSAFEGNDSDMDSPGNEENMYPTDNWVKFTLDLPIDSNKKNGNQWAYFTAGCVVLGDIVHQSVPNGLEKYAHKKLFAPLGIENYQWQYTPQKVANTAGGLQLRSVDYAKYGQLYQNNGKWNDTQLIPKSWVEKSFTHHQEIPDSSEEYYGYLFWNKKYQIGDQKYEVNYASGNGGNKIFVFKDIPVIVVITATAYGRPYAHPQVDQMMEEYILPAILD